MTRSKSKPRPITTYTHKRYMYDIFKESDVSPPQSPRVNTDLPKTPNAPVKKEKTFDLRQKRVTFDITAALDDIEAIKKVLMMFPCMDDDRIDVIAYKRTDVDIGHGKLMIYTQFSPLDKEVFIINQLLENFNLSEICKADLYDDPPAILYIWS